ncbi:60S ribosomal protein L15-like [Uranotaenia lowii]|uniref:60S ribosomal protein L15-like n=1 Tax=Uranotaenia lowii TaxID=190385 RepID=UPI002479C331|nr:60S ribosomal protein L15-like [Uranotaenia lowii]
MPYRCLQSVAKERTSRRFEGIRVLNFYWIARDVAYKHYGAIMVDTALNAICRDAMVECIANTLHKLRGLISGIMSSRVVGNVIKIGIPRRACWHRRNRFICTTTVTIKQSAARDL